MNIEAVTIEKADLHRLLASGSGDAAMLYLYIRSGNPSANAERELGLTGARLSCAAATLRQLGLLPQEQNPAFQPGERPAYSEQDVLQAMDRDADLLREIRAMNWAPYVLGLIVVALEVGFIYAYKAGWQVSMAFLVQSAFLAVILLFVGFFFYKEPLTWNKLLGAAICLAGLYVINIK